MGMCMNLAAALAWKHLEGKVHGSPATLSPSVQLHTEQLLRKDPKPVHQPPLCPPWSPDSLCSVQRTMTRNTARQGSDCLSFMFAEITCDSCPGGWDKGLGKQVLQCYVTQLAAEEVSTEWVAQAEGQRALIWSGSHLGYKDRRLDEAEDRTQVLGPPRKPGAGTTSPHTESNSRGFTFSGTDHHHSQVMVQDSVSQQEDR